MRLTAAAFPTSEAGYAVGELKKFIAQHFKANLFGLAHGFKVRWVVDNPRHQQELLLDMVAEIAPEYH